MKVKILTYFQFSLQETGLVPFPICRGLGWVRERELRVGSDTLVIISNLCYFKLAAIARRNPREKSALAKNFRERFLTPAGNRESTSTLY